MDKNKEMPSCGSKNKIERILSTWCYSRKKEYNNNNLTEDKISLLNALPGWKWKRDDMFMTMYNKIKEWILRNKKIPYANSSNSEEKQYGIWCRNKQVREKHGKLSEREINEIPYWRGFNKNIKKNKTYDEMFIELQNCISLNNRIPSSRSKNIIEAKCGKWCERNRCDYRKKMLSNDKIKKLEKIDGWYW